MVSVSKLMEVARAERELGNDFFYQNMFSKAMRKYEKVRKQLYLTKCD